MTNPVQTPDITIRGRQVNVPHSTTPRNPSRHQPNTPPTKKFKAAAAPKAKRHTKTKPPPAPDAPPDEGAPNNEPTTPS